MKSRLVCLLTCCILAAACSEKDSGNKEAPAPQAPDSGAPLATPGEPPPPEPKSPPLDIGDVDSGIFIQGILDPKSESETVTAEYIETLRDTLSLTTITVREPFPEQVLVRFELKAKRNFEGRPVVIRARAYRGDNEVIGEEYACIMGSDARNPVRGPDNVPFTHAYTVNVLEGLDAIPETMLVHGRADAWLMPEGTVETLIDPKSATSPDEVPLIGNPVRVNFIKAETDP